MSDTSTPDKAREHARAMAGTRVDSMPTVPPAALDDAPPGVAPADVLWRESLGAGAYASATLPRGARLRLVNTTGDACVQALVYNADHVVERLNVADTVKVQWQAYLEPGSLLLSDMGRALMSILEDTSHRHDLFCGCSSAPTNAAAYGDGQSYSPHPSGRDRFLTALGKLGMGEKDAAPSVNFFKGVKIDPDGATVLQPNPSPPASEHLLLRAEMNVLVVLANCPHVLDDRPAYTAGLVDVTAWRGEPTPIDDPVRNATPERQRAYENVELSFIGGPS